MDKNRLIILDLYAKWYMFMGPKGWMKIRGSGDNKDVAAIGVIQLFMAKFKKDATN